MKILHRPGAKHSNADALSRIPCKQCGFTTDWDKDIIVNALTTVQSYDGKESTAICKEGQKTLQQLQAEDDDIQVVVAWIKARKRPGQYTIGQYSYVVKTLWLNWQDLQLKHDLLYKTCKQGNELRFVVPMKERRTILEQCHDNMASGHLGIKKTWEG